MRQTMEQFTVEEVERLCLLYMDCQLSVLEETELEYVLSQTELDSPMIQDIRKLMGISRSVRISGIGKRSSSQGFIKWGLRAAACLAILVGSVTVLRNILATDDAVCIAFVEGHQVSTEQAHNIAEADIARMEQFMQAVATQRAAEEAKVKQFINTIQR